MKNYFQSCVVTPTNYALISFNLLRRTYGTVTLTALYLVLTAVVCVSSTAHAQSCPSGAAPTPLISVPSGNYTVAQTVTMSDALAGATIYYTTDGSYPWANSTTPAANAKIYTEPFEVSTTSSVLAIALAPSYCIPYFYAYSSIQFNQPAQDFTINLQTPSVNVKYGKQTTVALNVDPINGFDQQIGFSCSQSSTVLCSFSPELLTPAGATTVQLTLTGIPPVSVKNNSQIPYLPVTAIAGVLCFFGLRKRRRITTLLLAFLCLTGLGLFSGCGGGSSGPPVTAQITVTAQMANVTVSTLQHSTPLTVNVN